MDLSLPVLDGWEADPADQGRRATRHIPVHRAVGARDDRATARRRSLPDVTTTTPSRSILSGCCAKIDALMSRTRARDGSGAALLVVDDNEDNRYTLTRA